MELAVQPGAVDAGDFAIYGDVGQPGAHQFGYYEAVQCGLSSDLSAASGDGDLRGVQQRCAESGVGSGEWIASDFAKLYERQPAVFREDFLPVPLLESRLPASHSSLSLPTML